MQDNSINLKELNKTQKDIVRNLNNQIIEYQNIFQEQPEELLISKREYIELISSTKVDIKDAAKYKFLLLGKIKIYHV
jgi:hypothetical protein